jgi:hypothetical protein
MCNTRTVIYQGTVDPYPSHRFDVYSEVSTERVDCDLDVHINDIEAIWPIYEDIWENRGGPDGRCLFRVVVVPADWTDEDIRTSIGWWGTPSSGQVVP